MGRGKLRMELITKEKTRNTAYENRKNWIIKKLNELSVLCDVNTFMIVYPPDSSNQPEIWPKNPDDDQINKTISSYKLAKRNENNSKRSTYDISDYFQDRKRKIEDELVKARKRNREAKYSTWFNDLNGLSEGQLRQFAIGLENKEKIVRGHLQLKKRNQMPFGFEIQPAANGYVGSYLNHDALYHDLMSHDDLGWFNDEMSFKNNHNVGSYPPSQAMMSHDHWSKNVYFLNTQTGPHRLPILNVGSYPPSQAMMSHDHAPITWFTPGDVVYDDNSNPCAFQPVGLVPEALALQDSHDGVGGFVIDDAIGMFMG